MLAFCASVKSQSRRMIASYSARFRHKHSVGPTDCACAQPCQHTHPPGHLDCVTYHCSCTAPVFGIQQAHLAEERARVQLHDLHVVVQHRMVRPRHIAKRRRSPPLEYAAVTRCTATTRRTPLPQQAQRGRSDHRCGAQTEPAGGSVVPVR